MKKHQPKFQLGDIVKDRLTKKKLIILDRVWFSNLYKCRDTDDQISNYFEFELEKIK